MSEPVWRPSREVVERANVTRLIRRHGLGEYRELLRRSQREPEWFWPAAVEDMELEFATPWRRVLDDSRGPEWATWFDGATLSVAWNCVHRWAQRAPDRLAVVGHGEDGTRSALTYRELAEAITRLAEGLAGLGVGAGDRVAIYLPMLPAAAIASHACAHLGAVQVPLFSGFGAGALAQRLADADAKVVITADGSLRRGRMVPMKEVVDEALAAVPSVEHVVVWSRLGRDDVPMLPGRDVDWDELLDGGAGALPPLVVEAEHPYMLVYTSGTAGAPKGIVHVQGGFLVSVAREVCYHADAGPEDVLHYVADLGWIMGPWAIVGGQALGCTVVLAEGAPDHPEPDRLWRLLADDRATILGVSPTLVRGLMPHGDPTVDLSALRVIVTAGEPWNAEPYRWLFERVGAGRRPIVNCAGGTEVASLFLAPTVVEPIKSCSLGGPALGMDVDVVDDAGRSLVGRGEVGELVCRRPAPGMTRGLWRDQERYLDTYWRRLPGVWVHGDWASVDADGYWFLHGRSDDTLKVAGKRIGPAEIESALVDHPAVIEAAAVGVPDPVRGELPWAVCVLRPGVVADGVLAEELRATVATSLGASFRPARIAFVSALPKTRSGKIVRRAIRAAATGADPGDLSTLEDPAVLEEVARALA